MYKHSDLKDGDEVSDKRYLLGQGGLEPVYDKPMQKKNINTLRKRKDELDWT